MLLTLMCLLLGESTRAAVHLMPAHAMLVVGGHKRRLSSEQQQQHTSLVLPSLGGGYHCSYVAETTDIILYDQQSIFVEFGRPNH
jgi:hypothetical protein